MLEALSKMHTTEWRASATSCPTVRWREARSFWLSCPSAELGCVFPARTLEPTACAVRTTWRYNGAETGWLTDGAWREEAGKGAPPLLPPLPACRCMQSGP